MPGFGDLVSVNGAEGAGGDLAASGAGGLGGVASGAAALPGHAEKHLGFLQAGNAQAASGVEGAAQQGIQVAGKATDMAISVAKVGISAAVWVVKAGVTIACTAAGAPEAADAINKPIDLVEGAVDKGIEKAQESAKQGESAVKAA